MQHPLSPGVVASALLACPGVAGCSNSTTSSCCQALEGAGVGVIYPGSELYGNRTESYWSVTSQLTPWCIAQPTSAQEVSTAVVTLVQDTSCQFAIRSGGHFIWPANNIEEGVTVDLGLMNATTYDEETQVASIYPGSRWRGVYETLDPHNVTVPGGRAASVGVAGFLTGGGNSFYSARKGFACDNVVNFEVVLANGEIINANATDNSDLFQSLKGGQSNFGIVTRFDMQAFDAPPLWGGVVQYNKTTGPQHIDAYVDWTNNVQNDVNGSTIIFWSYQPALKDIVIIAAYEDTGGNVAAPAFDQFLAIPGNLSSTMRIASHLELTNELEQPTGYRDIWWTGTIKNDKRVYEKIIELHQELCDFMAAQSPDGDFITQAMFQSIPTIFSQHGEEKGGNVLGLDRETENVVMLLFTLAVNGEEQQAVAQEQMRKFGEATMEYASSIDAAVEWEYINYSYDYQNPLASYGDANIAKIRAAAAKYDPSGVFQTRAPGGYKITRSSGTVA
ncbi:hypothetical protein JX265_007305 [Neoarthrinium moseri]|uniref:FAD-binding PCMH-type domain-containing protein n=1 Tax=Neoarthrinium moseri TaxID=1658444 RepID=A0A9P9WK72_9PEZI|nr:hypothetical protein JX265_007305 [Neoarthrinium moseri]